MAAGTRTPAPKEGHDRRQLNMRLDDETESLIVELVPVVSKALGLKVSQSDLMRLAVKSLAREYLTKGRR